MAEYLAQGEDLTAVANAIRSKGSITGALIFPADFVAAIGNFKGWPSPTAYLRSGTPYTEVSVENSVKTIRANAFYHSTALKAASLPAVTEVKTGAFDWCLNMVSVSAPVLTAVEANAFKACAKLESFSAPNLEKIGDYGFNGCAKLTSVDLSNVTELGAGAFSNSGLAGPLALPKFTGAAVKTACFANAKITSISLPLSTAVGHSWFQRCPISRVNAADVPLAADIQDWAFSYCTSLTRAELPAATRIRRYTFRGSGLETLILSNPDVVCAVAADSLMDTPITGGTGYVYVPQALLDRYKAATNWSAVGDQIRAIEDYPEIVEGEA